MSQIKYNRIYHNEKVYLSLSEGHISVNENVYRELLLALIKKFNCECLATLECD